MKIEVTVYGHNIYDENDKFCIDFIIPDKYSLADLKDKHSFLSMLNDEIFSRVKYEFIILDYDVMSYFDCPNEEL